MKPACVNPTGVDQPVVADAYDTYANTNVLTTLVVIDGVVYGETSWFKSYVLFCVRLCFVGRQLLL